MKRLLIASIAINVMLLLFLINHNEYDVNYDNKVNSKDLLDLKKYLLEQEIE